MNDLEKTILFNWWQVPEVPMAGWKLAGTMIIQRRVFSILFQDRNAREPNWVTRRKLSIFNCPPQSTHQVQNSTFNVNGVCFMIKIKHSSQTQDTEGCQRQKRKHAFNYTERQNEACQLKSQNPEVFQCCQKLQLISQNFNYNHQVHITLLQNFFLLLLLLLCLPRDSIKDLAYTILLSEKHSNVSYYIWHIELGK